MRLKKKTGLIALMIHCAPRKASIQRCGFTARSTISIVGSCPKFTFIATATGEPSVGDGTMLLAILVPITQSVVTALNSASRLLHQFYTSAALMLRLWRCDL